MIPCPHGNNPDVCGFCWRERGQKAEARLRELEAQAEITRLRQPLGICHAALDPTMPPLRPGARERLMQDIRVALWGPSERPACNRKEQP